MMRAWLFLGALLLHACARHPEDEPLVLLEFRQNELDSVALNEELVFFFSRDLDPTSVTSDSLRVLDASGREVRGERRLRGDALSFLPELPCRPDLSDGGFRPGAEYSVVLGGFPRPDGLRALDGALLSASLRLRFRTASPEQGTVLFLDPFAQPFPLRIRARSSNPPVLEDGRLVLEAREALDPSLVPRARFELRRGTEEVVPARLELVQNRRDGSRLEVVPLAAGPDRRLEPGTYYFTLRDDLRTLGQRTLEPAWRREVPLALIVPSRHLRVDFTARDERPPEVPPDCDGTALALPDGSGLRVRFPAAAGDGRDGRVTLDAPPDRRELSASRLEVLAGATVDLSAQRGPVVWRSQGALQLAGRVVRRTAGAGAGGPLARELRELADGLSNTAPEVRPPLGAWLARVLASDEDWTVLVAGGDLRVPAGGVLDVDGPLVLVAGGWIRVAGEVRCEGDLWKTAEGGGGILVHGGAIGVLPLALDAPAVNPLVEPLCFGRAMRLAPAGAPDGGLRVVPLAASSSAAVSAELELDPVLGARLSLRFRLVPRAGEPWLAPESGVELERDAPAAEAR